MNFDYSKTYYKITNEKEKHYNFQYKNGLNVLKEKFNNNPLDSCVPGGFYFTDQNNIFGFLDGYWVREVSIPPDAQVVLDPDGNKWRTDKIIFEKKYTILEFLECYFSMLFDKESFDYKNYSRELAESCSTYFDKWFDKKRFNYRLGSWELAAYCPKHFDKWFDKKRFNYTDGSDALARHCSKYHKKWSQ